VLALGIVSHHGQSVAAPPFTGHGTGSFTSANFDFLASGIASRLGLFTHYGALVLTPTSDPLVFIVSGTTTYEAANGDKLYAVLDGPLNVATGVATGTDTWIGGTGRFEGASGGAEVTAVLAPDGSFTFDWTGNLVF